MIKEKLRWVGVTSLFFGLVGGLIGTAFTFSLMLVRMPISPKKDSCFRWLCFFQAICLECLLQVSLVLHTHFCAWQLELSVNVLGRVAFA